MTYGCLGNWVTKLVCPREHFGIDEEAFGPRQ